MATPVNPDCCTSPPCAPSEEESVQQTTSGAQPWPLVALIPIDSWLDREATAAKAAGLPVYRFPPMLGRDDNAELGPLDPKPPECSGPAWVIHRGFMMTGETYASLYQQLQQRYGWRLVVGPEEYERAHYYPNSYPFLRDVSPRAVWTECPTLGDPGAVITRDTFLEAAKVVCSWGCQFAVIKDYVKSAKDSPGGAERFLKVPAQDPVELAERAIELLAARGARFNRGVVFKEYVPLKKYRDAWGRERNTNEWRCFFGPNGRLLSMDRNSVQPHDAPPPPEALVEAASEAARAIGSPYMTVDLAETANADRDDGARRWIVLEAGDGGVSGTATDQDINEHWRALAECFRSFCSTCKSDKQQCDCQRKCGA